MKGMRKRNAIEMKRGDEVKERKREQKRVWNIRLIASHLHHICLPRYPCINLYINCCHSMSLLPFSNWATLLTCLRSSVDCVNIAFVLPIESVWKRDRRAKEQPRHEKKRSEQKKHTQENETESQPVSDGVHFAQKFVEFDKNHFSYTSCLFLWFLPTSTIYK